MKKLVLLIIALFAVTAGTAYAATQSVHVRNGDNIYSAKVLCVVRQNAITCGANGQSKVTVTASAQGVGVQINGHARLVCLNNGICAKP
jgi:hypothetical protein